MGRRQVPYPPEFREEAVRLVRNGGKSIGRVARDLGIADQSLRNWVKQSARPIDLPPSRTSRTTSSRNSRG